MGQAGVPMGVRQRYASVFVVFLRWGSSIQVSAGDGGRRSTTLSHLPILEAFAQKWCL